MKLFNKLSNLERIGFASHECYLFIYNDIYMKITEGFKLHESVGTKSCSMYSIKLQQSLYGLKQFKYMWFNSLSEYLLREGYVNNPICP